MPADANIATELNWDSTVELGHFHVFLNKLSTTTSLDYWRITDTTVSQHNTLGSERSWNQWSEFLNGDKQNKKFEPE